MKIAENIAEVHAHLNAGNEVAIVTYTRTQVLTKKNVGYIRQAADGKGYRLGWPGRSSVYAMPESVRLVPAGKTIR